MNTMTQIQALNFIDGNWQTAQQGSFVDSRNPADGKRIGSFAAGASEDAEAAIQTARRGFERSDWSHDPRLRQLVLLDWADRMEARIEELSKLLTLENGKPLGHSQSELQGAISEIRYYAGLARYIPGHVFEVEPGIYSTLLREPAGVAGLIIPWNAPVVLLIRALAPALAAGCSAVIKPAPQTALITAEVIKCLVEARKLPREIVNLVSEQGHEVARHLIESPEVDVVSFTGSNAIGQAIMAAAAPTMKKLSLELGGKSACLIFEDVDIAQVAPKLADAATVIAGQQCTAARRVLVHASRYEEMREALRASLSKLKVGPGSDPSVQMGPLIDPVALEQVWRRTSDAMTAADEVILPGSRLGGALEAGCFLTPTLVAHRDSAAFFVQEEIFGPFVVLEKFEDEQEAIARANHSEYGLSASIWTNHGARAMRVARALRNGTVWINDHNKLFAEAETGGYRRSGIGRLHGFDGLLDFMEVKHVYQNCGVAQLT